MLIKFYQLGVFQLGGRHFKASNNLFWLLVWWIIRFYAHHLLWTMKEPFPVIIHYYLLYNFTHLRIWMYNLCFLWTLYIPFTVCETRSWYKFMLWSSKYEAVSLGKWWDWTDSEIWVSWDELTVFDDCNKLNTCEIWIKMFCFYVFKANMSKLDNIFQY